MKHLKVANRLITQSSRRASINVSVDSDIYDKREVYNWDHAIPYENIPGPKPLPLLGNTWRFLPYIGDFEIEHVDKISKRLYEQYGSVVKMGGLLGRPDMIFLFDPDEIERVFRQEDNLPLRPSMPSLNYYKHVYNKEFFGDVGGVIAVHGEKWQNFRTKVNQIMMQPRVAKMYMKPIENTAREFVDRIRMLRDNKDEVPDDFLNEIHKWSLESIAKVALDVRLGCFDDNSDRETQTLIDAVNTFFINVPVLELKIPFWRLFNTPTFNKYISSLEAIREITTKHVNVALANLNCKNQTNEQSVLERVLRMDNNAKIATILALDLFLVGIDTTSNAVASILYQLALHPEKQEKLFQEISQFLPHAKSELNNSKIEQMSYLKACIRETLRMYPVVIGNGRCTTRDCIIGGYQIPKGVQIIFQHYVMSNLDKYFENSSQFLPERWIKKCPGESNSKTNHAFTSLPFGYGRRMCLGKRFADLEIQTVVAKVIQSYKLEYHYEPLDYHVHPMYTPNGPLKIRFIERQT